VKDPGPLRLMIYDRTCTADFPKPGAISREHGVIKLGDRLRRRAGELLEGAPWPGLSHSWWVGGVLYSTLGRLDDWRGFASWGAALEWLAEHRGDEPIGEIQFWGHGKWGAAKIGDESLDLAVLDPRHEHHDKLLAIRERLRPRGERPPLWWFRTCETFGAQCGHEFARAWAEFFGCRAAGHTYVIGPYQSGLHTIDPGETPRWSIDEGLIEGTVDAPRRARWSTRGEPNTITCLRGTIPAGF
jgi:hypothetical protein